MSKNNDRPGDGGIDRLSLETDIVELRNGLAALNMIWMALESDVVGNDKIAARGVRFAEETMSAALERLAEKAGLACAST